MLEAACEKVFTYILLQATQQTSWTSRIVEALYICVYGEVGDWMWRGKAYVKGTRGEKGYHRPCDMHS